MDKILEIGTHDLTIHRGATKREKFLVRTEDPADSTKTIVFDMTGLTGSAEVRSRDELLLTFVVTIDVPLGEITIAASAAATSLLKIAPDAEWDLYLQDTTGEGFYLLSGHVELDPQVTTSV